MELKHGSPERGLVWKCFAESLNEIKESKCEVDDPAVKDHLEKKFRKRQSEEARTSNRRKRRNKLTKGYEM